MLPKQVFQITYLLAGLFTAWPGCAQTDSYSDDANPNILTKAEKQAFVRKLAKTGMPAEWEGKSPWWIPEK